jgi:undecaprenyl-diphosphatase
MNVQILLIMVFLAIVQGVAEFLPISSSGHLTLIQNIPWVSAQLAVMGGNAEMFLNVMLHLATLAGVLIFLRKDLWNIIRGFFVSIARREWMSPAMRTVGYLFLASIPAGLAGILLNDFFERMFSSPRQLPVC